MKSIVITFAVGLLSCNAAWARVMVVHSYHPSYQWTSEINRAVVKELVVAGVQYRILFMDTKRHPGEKFKQQAALKAKKEIAVYKPEVVIAVDDNAQAYLVTDYVNKSDIQFVFCGVNAEPEKYGYPARNVTGILERSYPHQTLRMLKAIMPKTRQIAVVSDDSPTSTPILQRMKHKANKGLLDIPIREYVRPSTFSQWQEAIVRLNRDPSIDALMIPVYHTVKIDGTATSMAPREVMQWTIGNTTKPVVGMWSFGVEDGAFFAVTVDPREHGRVAARMAIEILGGKKAGDIPMVTNQEGYVIVNLKGAKHFDLDWNIDIEQFADRVIK